MLRWVLAAILAFLGFCGEVGTGEPGAESTLNDARKVLAP